MKKLLSKLALGKKFAESKMADKVLSGLKDRYGYAIEKKTLGMYINIAIVIILGLALLFGKISLEEFNQGIENI